MKKNVFWSFVLVIIFIIGLFVINGLAKTYRPTNINTVTIAGKNIFVDVVTEHKQKQQGLSGRSSIAEDEGMLFVFDKSDSYSFWMEDMNFPIDIIWIGENMKIVYIEKNVKPESYPKSFGSDTYAKYVLELKSGFSDRNNLKAGDKVMFIYK